MIGRPTRVASRASGWRNAAASRLAGNTTRALNDKRSQCVGSVSEKRENCRPLVGLFGNNLESLGSKILGSIEAIRQETLLAIKLWIDTCAGVVESSTSRRKKPAL